VIYEPYTITRTGGSVEVGFTFKEQAGDDECIFDLALADVQQFENTRTQEIWDKHRWAAEAIIAAAKEQGR
jgi:hypothetical protein